MNSFSAVHHAVSSCLICGLIWACFNPAAITAERASKCSPGIDILMSDLDGIAIEEVDKFVLSFEDSPTIQFDQLGRLAK